MFKNKKKELYGFILYFFGENDKGKIYYYRKEE